MSWPFRSILILCCWLISFVALASMPPTFERLEDEARYTTLIKNIRCVTCQNQSLSESNAPVAEAMRTEIVNQFNAGRSEQEITDFLVERYGDFVLYRPPLKGHTLPLWLAPIGIAFIALGGMIWSVVRRKEKRNVKQ
ncbi:MAG: cytochrome c-type biogenesis protein [Gammaproteobacteria bacterium]